DADGSSSGNLLAADHFRRRECNSAASPHQSHRRRNSCSRLARRRRHRRADREPLRDPSAWRTATLSARLDGACGSRKVGLRYGRAPGRSLLHRPGQRMNACPLGTAGPGVRAFLFLASLVLCAAPAQSESLVADLTTHLIAITAGFTGASVVLFGATD